MPIYQAIKIDFIKTLLLLFVITSILFSQQKVRVEQRYGSVSYISSQNIYVKFASTDSINTGDTLFYPKGTLAVPAVIVKYISSKSCAGENISAIELKNNDRLFAKIKITEKEPDFNAIQKDAAIGNENRANTVSGSRTGISKKNYWGRFSIQSMSSFSNTLNNDDQRWRYSFSLNADSINGSGFSFSSYLFFAYNVKNWNQIKNNPASALKIYDLAISYKINSKSKIWLGRYLNPRISNVGSIDGIQYQNQIGNYYMGAVLGSHPNFTDYGYNLKMFEYGGYVGRIDSIANTQMENTLAFMNQTNNFKTDRRYLYFQHSNNIIKNTNIFASTEFDLFKVENGNNKSSFDLTSLFISMHVSPFRLLSFSLSFDARKNAIYYETYKTYLENLLSNELRKGYRLSIYLRPSDNLSIALNGGYSYKNNDPKPARNYGINLSYYDIPLINFSGNLTYSKLTSSYTDGTISGIRFSKYINALDLNFSLDYRNIKYEFNSGIEPIIQNIASAEISFKLPLGIYLGINYEGVFEKQNTWGRFFIDLTKRF